MGDRENRFGVAEWMGQTTLHPVGVLAIVSLGTALLLLPRRYAVIPILAMACFVSPAQRVVLFSLNFSFLRLMALFGSIRIVSRGEARGLRWKALDTAFTCYVVAAFVDYVILWGDADALKWRLGWAYDAVGLYFVFRCLVRDWTDVAIIGRTFAVLSIPVAACFLVERSTGRNLFAFLGGVPEVTTARDGRLRCQGAFAHPILAGCFWAVVLPLMVASWYERPRGRAVIAAGIASALVVIVTCASSTPVSATLCAVLAAALFPLRARMRTLRWALVMVLIGLHCVMKAPVWHLLSRIDVAGGSTGWYRYWLIDLAIRNFGDWWLIGSRDASAWQAIFPALDLTNQYVYEGVNGGLLSLSLFIAVIVLAFQAVGRLWRLAGNQRSRTIMAWALGVSLFVHTMNFLSVSYFGQITMLWYLNVALIASLAPASAGSSAVHSRSARRRPASARSTLVRAR